MTRRPRSPLVTAEATIMGEPDMYMVRRERIKWASMRAMSDGVTSSEKLEEDCRDAPVGVPTEPESLLSNTLSAVSTDTVG